MGTPVPEPILASATFHNNHAWEFFIFIFLYIEVNRGRNKTKVEKDGEPGNFEFLRKWMIVCKLGKMKIGES
jgi:hypothetical protein